MKPVDAFSPKSEPARSIFEAFQEEASKRNGRAISEWELAEIEAVHRTAGHQAIVHGLRIPTRDEIVAAERLARGHADYGSKWAYGVVSAMQKSEPGQSHGASHDAN